MKLLKLFCLFHFFSWALSNQAQNFIPNPSFEDTILNSYGPVPLFWPRDSLLGSPDYFSPHYTNQNSDLQTPTNNRGYQVPADSSAYFGLFVYNYLSANSREYLQIRLVDTLVQGEQYLLTFKISLADSFRVAVDYKDIGVAFRQTRLPNNLDHQIRPLPHFYSDSIWDATNKVTWQEFNATYTAQGGERIMLIGNFKTDTNTDTMQLNSGGSNIAFSAFSYYYVDQLSLTKKISTQIIKNELEKLILVFPNPVKDQLKIQSSSNRQLDFKLFNLQGQAIQFSLKSSYPNEFQIDLNGQASGIYLLQVSDGKNQVNRKIIKH